jgi:hypothetical protein
MRLTSRSTILRRQTAVWELKAEENIININIININIINNIINNTNRRERGNHGERRKRASKTG